MSTACNLPYCDEDKEMLDAAARGENNTIAPEVMEWLEKAEEALKIAEERWERLESLEMNLQGVIEPSIACEDPKEVIANADPDTVIISYGPKVPVFITDFEDTGQELSKHIKDYPEDFPEVKVYTPVLPTIKNLSRMLGLERGDCRILSPFSPWGDKIHLHHYQQDPKGPLMMIGERFHREVPHTNKGLSPEDRRRYAEIQRPKIWKMAAETYLGSLTKEFIDAIKLRKEEEDGQRRKNT